MIRNTFCHLPGIGMRTEHRLWHLGVRSWDDLGRVESAHLPIGQARIRILARHLEESLLHLQQHDPHFFADRLAADQHWRLFPDFREDLAYLDIETTGMGSPLDTITTIALYDGRTIRWYVQGKSLDRFRDDIQGYRVIVTYNGKSFDLPFIRNTLRIPMDQVHIDLRYVLASLGYRGGLKGCEHQLGMGREELEGVDGFFAVLLWNEYQRKNNVRALETLLAYNILDVVNLETLMVLAYNQKMTATPFAQTHQLPIPTTPRGPFTPDLAIIEDLRARIWRG